MLKISSKEPNWLRSRPHIRHLLKRRHALKRKLANVKDKFSYYYQNSNEHYSTLKEKVNQEIASAIAEDLRIKNDALNSRNLSPREYYSNVKKIIGISHSSEIPHLSKADSTLTEQHKRKQNY